MSPKKLLYKKTTILLCSAKNKILELELGDAGRDAG